VIGSTIRAVDGSACADVLSRMQRRVLPYDKPAATTIGWWWLAFDGDEPVGFAGLYQSSRWCDAGYLCRAGVVPSHRGQGLQKRLIRARERKARAVGFRWLITDTNDNPSSGNSLISSGFRLYSPSKPWAADGALYWRKPIERKSA
jgi:GNAT superfamily N-acetyltransferase